ncbi:hypothetical protein ABWK22_12150 [Gottfriedia acidiceleris]|uniref:hypothetical protein n=1 Tax=Gottfriedia acidiceleris TaxID=371036 RepID=UPI0033941633
MFVYINLFVAIVIILLVSFFFYFSYKIIRGKKTINSWITLIGLSAFIFIVIWQVLIALGVVQP